ncbi:MAG: PIN domain-containing protein [Spirochaetota bacterium]
MTEPVFLDTNILVYAYDTYDQQKQNKAQEILREGIKNRNLVASAQVLGEFFIAVTRRIGNPVSTEDAQVLINGFQFLEITALDRLTVTRAIQTHLQYGLSYWDALIIATAEQAGCKTVLTEDLNHGQIYSGITVRNPFREEAADKNPF